MAPSNRFVTRIVPCLAVSLSLCVAAEDSLSFSLSPRQDPHQNYFTTPTQASIQDDYQDDPSYDQGTQLNITWETGLPSVDLILCQPALDGTFGQTRLIANTTEHWFLWNVTYSDVTVYAGPVGDVFFFQFRPPAAKVPFFNSHYFNVTKPKPGSTSSISNGASATGTGASSTKVSSPTASDSNSTDSQSAQSKANTSDPSSSTSGSSDLSSNAVIAISICAALAAGVLATLATLLIIRRRRRQRNSSQKPGKVYITDMALSSRSTQSIGPPQEMQGFSPIQEIGTRPLPHEVETQESRLEMETRETPIELPADVER